MKTYKKIYSEILADGGRQIERYICNEDQRLTIEIERGSMRHNRPTGYVLKYNGKTDFAGGIADYITLSEAKDWADYFFPNI